ncbi:MAG: hypothetical protein P4L46_11145, partial [Fimbriimonas sp.]|nr:hypothetical protein [Fimbriimonas sp.]
DMQLNIPAYELRARNATLKMGAVEKHFDELYLKLNVRFGYGTTSFVAKQADGIISQGHGIAFVRRQADGSYTKPPEVERYGLVEIHRSGVSPAAAQSSTLFEFQDLSGSPSTVSAKKAVIFPHKVIQFQRVDIYVAASKVMSLPLYEVPLAGAHSPLVTDQIVSVSNSQVGINFPYYVALRPGVTEFFSFKTGMVEGRSSTSDHGAFLNYEFDWNKGDDMQGGLQVQGIGRDDWSIGVNQFVRMDDRTTAFAQLLTPTGQSFYGSGSISHQFNGFSTSFTGAATRTLTGIQDTNQNYSLIVEKDPIKVGSLPVRLTPGVTATMSSDQLDGQTQSGYGGRLRAQTLPLVVDPNTNVTMSFQASYLKGTNELPGLQYLGNVSISRRLSAAASLLFTYDYTRDGFNEDVLGEHRVSMQAFYNRGRVNMSLFGSRSLDLSRTTVFGDLSYRLGRLWRLSSSYTSDIYLNDTYLDYTFGFGYTLGWREVGLVWSAQTQRIGLQLLGATVY